MTTNAVAPYVLPTINLNGSSARDLLEEQVAVLRAVGTLRSALAQSCPNGRDYQHAPETYPAARLEWEVAMQHLERIRDRAECIAEHIADHDRR